MSEAKQTTYWKSLNELAQNEEYKNFVEREFPENASELTNKLSRKGFLGLMGSAVLLASCDFARRPVQKILPYSRQPENVVAGIPLFYATAMPFMGSLTGLVAENNSGRPTKLEGNDLHPSSLGATNAYHQAAVLGLYDPDRSRSILKSNERANVDDFISFVNSNFSDTSKRIAFLSEANSSLTLNRLKTQTLGKYSNSEWVTYEAFGEENAFEGNRLAFGSRLRTYNHFDKADVVLSLNDDFLAPTHPNSVEYAKKLTSKRKVTSNIEAISRIYAVEDSFSLTGAFADNRLRLKASQIEAFTHALAAELSKRVSGLNAFSSISNEFSSHKWISALTEDLLDNLVNSVVTIGLQQPASAHAAVAAINLALGNVGNSVQYLELPFAQTENQNTKFASLVEEMKSGSVDTLVLIGTNPAYTASGHNFNEALENVSNVIHLSDYVDETSKKATWHVNRAHFLEAWGDGFSYDGTRSIIQPQILPLHEGLSEIEFLNIILNGEMTAGHDLVKSTFEGIYGSNLSSRWDTILHDGVDSSTGFKAVTPRLASNFSSSLNTSAQSSNSGLEIVIRPDASLYDGRYSNIAWLQELPDPMTKITWDNVALMSPNTARDLGVENEDLVTIESNGKTIEIAAWIQPGHVDGSITLTTGYGREGIGRVADRYIDFTAGGVDIYPLLGNSYINSASVSKTGSTYEIACVQDHHSLEGRDMYRQATVEEYAKNPDYASFESVHTYPVPGLEAAAALGEDVPISLFDEQTYPDYEPQWGMAIDLNSCFGCGVCIIACQSENNIPVIGKKEVARGREMHWIRNDRYYVGTGSSKEEMENDPNLQAVHQPVPCMHCELAPCEQVCPVAATTHSDDGMNQMTYNRCIGTRYCANNCPYKVRRFNFFNYPKEFLTTGADPDIIQMAMNPEVTVRFRGVMEKCTYCVQRVNREKIQAKIKTGSPKPADGTVVTACQQACPAGAIYFGDLTDNNSVVAKMKRNERNFQMLEELNTRPRTSYMAKLTNPNKALV